MMIVNSQMIVWNVDRILTVVKYLGIEVLTNNTKSIHILRTQRGLGI